jgi:hypothetical protein
MLIARSCNRGLLAAQVARDGSERGGARSLRHKQEKPVCCRAQSDDRRDALPLVCQAQQRNISRSSIYYPLRPVSPANLASIRRIDELGT